MIGLCIFSFFNTYVFSSINACIEPLPMRWLNRFEEKRSKPYSQLVEVIVSQYLCNQNNATNKWNAFVFRQHTSSLAEWRSLKTCDLTPAASRLRTWWLITSHYTTTAETRPARWRSHQERTEAALWRMVPSSGRWNLTGLGEGDRAVQDMRYSVTGRPSEKRHIFLGCSKYWLLSKSPFFLIVGH